MMVLPKRKPKKSLHFWNLARQFLQIIIISIRLIPLFKIEGNIMGEIRLELLLIWSFIVGLARSIR